MSTCKFGESLLLPPQTLVFRTPGISLTVVGASTDIWLVGKKEGLCSVADGLGEFLKLPALALMAKSLVPGYAGKVSELTWLAASGELSKVTLVALPEAASRFVSAIRPDVIAKLLHGKIMGTEVLLAVGTDDVIAAGMAVARCLPSYTAKTNRLRETSVCHVSFFGCEPSTEVLQRLQLAAEGLRVSQGLVDMPPNVVYPLSFKEFVLGAVEGIPGVSANVTEGEQLRDQGLGLLYATGKAAATPPCLIVLTHSGASEASAGMGKKGVAIVGKGITFDTGGAALKTAEGMRGMKRDMAGAAGMLGAFLALAKSGGLPSGKPLHCVLCVAENSIGSKCFLQDDILHSYSGLTVEIGNTDCEGRLVLADGVSFVAKNLNCDLVIDMATLTGAQGVSTGHHHATIVASDDDLERQCVLAGNVSGDMVHPGLFAPELLMHEFDSDFADMTNCNKNRSNAPASCAGLFIHRHLLHSGYEGRWLHVDMAEPSYAPLGGFSTGWGVALLTTLLNSARTFDFEPAART